MNLNFWKLYKTTEDGKNAINAFNSIGKDYSEWLDGIYSICNNYDSDQDPKLLTHLTFLLSVNSELQKWTDGVFTIEDFLFGFQLYDLKANKNGNYIVGADGKYEIDESRPLIKADQLRKKAEFMHLISTYLFAEISPSFIPILYSKRFDVFSRNCEILGIELPEIPKTKDYSQYLYYYLDICEAIEQFKEENNLTPEEVCACIYYYAPLEIDDNGQNAELPRPTNIWLTGASNADIRLLDASNCQFTGTWACNENTCAGDIVVLYATAPHSCIHSIWRAETGGRFNPFDHFHCRTTVTNGVKVPSVRLSELKEDPVFGSLPMMNNNLHGINGRELPPQAYEALLRIIEIKGGDISLLPKLFDGRDWNPGVINNEHDVEEKILIPCLKELGYTEEDWSRQLKQQAGRKEKAIPDFVFFPRGERHAENAPLVIEAKNSNLLSSDIERNKAYRQARSYAKMMESGIFAICDAERMIVYNRSINGLFDYSKPAFEGRWCVIWADSSIFSKLNKLIGAETIKNIK